MAQWCISLLTVISWCGIGRKLSWKKCIVILYEIHDAIKFLVSYIVECSISEINYLDVFISKTGNKWNTTISWKPQTGIICFIQPVTILRLLKKFYFIAILRTCRICNYGSGYRVKMDYLINKYREWDYNQEYIMEANSTCIK